MVLQKNIKFDDLIIPRDTWISIPLVEIHHVEILGRRCKFNPLRFFDGISTFAKHPNMLRAFGKGLRACIGQNFAMLETKTKIALMFDYVWFFGF